MTPAEDPQFLAFVRAAGMDEAVLSTMAARQKQQLDTGAALRQPEYDQQLREGQRGIEEDFASRGVYGSGVRTERQNEQARDVEGRVQKDRIQTQDDKDSIDLNLAQQIAQLRRKTAEESLNATQRVTLGNARGVLTPLGA